MTKSELNQRTESAIIATQEALQIVYDTLNVGQRKQLIKAEKVKLLFDRYGVKYE